MNYLSLGLGAIIGFVILKPMLIALVLPMGKVDTKFQLIMLSSDILILLGIGFGYFIVRTYSLSTRLSQITYPKSLKFGVWSFYSILSLYLIAKLVPYAGYAIVSSIPYTRQFLVNVNLYFTLSLTFILIGVFLTLLLTNVNHTTNGS